MKLYKGKDIVNAMKEQAPLFVKHGWSKTPPAQPNSNSIDELVVSEETDTGKAPVVTVVQSETEAETTKAIPKSRRRVKAK